MQVVAEDGVPLASPYWLDTLTIAPAERFDVLVKANNPGVWMFHTHVDSHITNDEQSPGGMMTMLVYDGYENQCADCRAESPGGMPYSPPVPMPQTFTNSSLVSFPAGVGSEPPQPATPQAPPAHATWTFPVDLPCAVKSVRLDAQLSGGSVLGASLTHLDLTLRDPNGTYVVSPRDPLTLGRSGTSTSGNPSVTWTHNGTQAGKAEPFFLAGAYTVELNGTAVQSTVALHVSVEYYGSFAEQRLLHQLDPSKVLRCGKYGYGNDSIPRGPAPE